MAVQSAIQKLQDELQRRFRIAGRGSVTRVQDILQLGSGYFRDLRRPERQRLDLRVLLGALEILEVESSEFFASVFGSSNPVDSFLSEAVELRRKMRRLPQILRTVESRQGLDEAGELLDNQVLNHLDGLRRTSPSIAMRECREAATRAHWSQVPRILGSYASACRAASRYKEACVVAAQALRLAVEQDDLGLQADLIQRIAYIVGTDGDQEKALLILEKATLLYARLADTARIGQTLVDQGVFKGYLGQAEQSIELFKTALTLIPEDAVGNLEAARVSAQFNLAVTSMNLGRLEDAQKYAAEARQGMASQGLVAVGKAMWLQAEVAKAQGQSEQAEELLSETVEIFRDFEPLTASIVAVDLVRWQLQVGKALAAYATAKAMISLLKPLESNRLASAAITEMVRCALAGQGLTSKLLDGITSGLEKANASKAAGKR